MEEDGGRQGIRRRPGPGRRRGIRRRRDLWRGWDAVDALDAADAAVLDGLAQRSGVPDPATLLEDRELFGQLVAQAVRAVERAPELAPEDRHLWVARYFRLEERVERRAAGDPRRRSRRRQVAWPCTITPLRAPAGAGPQPPSAPAPMPEALAPEPPVMATVLDVSTGGCAVHLLGPFAEGKMAGIDFDLDGRTPVTAIGRACGVRPQRPAGTIVHLRFARLSHEHRNRIYRFVHHADRRRADDGREGDDGQYRR